MESSGPGKTHDIRYEPNERPPHMLAFGLGFQAALLCLGGVVLTPAIVIRAAGQSETYLSWAIFMAVVVSGISTILQAVRVGRFGAGHVLIMGTSGAFIAVCVTALTKVCLLDKRVAHMEAALEKIFGGQTAKLVLILPKFRRKIGLDSYLVEKEKAEKCVATTYDSCM